MCAGGVADITRFLVPAFEALMPCHVRDLIQHVRASLPNCLMLVEYLFVFWPNHTIGTQYIP
jgi:hypothetical protein